MVMRLLAVCTISTVCFLTALEASERGISTQDSAQTLPSETAEETFDLVDSDSQDALLLTSENDQEIPVSQTTQEETSEEKITTSGPVIVDRIRAVCYTDDGMYVITQSDLDRPRVDGTWANFEDLCAEPYICQDARRFHVEQDPEMVDKYFEEVRRNNNISIKQLEQILKNAGYTYEEARNQIGMLMQISSFFGFKFGAGRLTISEADIRAYYNEHPEYEEVQVFIERAFVPLYVTDNPEIAEQLVKNDSIEIVKGQPFWVNQGEIAQDKQFFFTLPLKQWSEAYKTSSGFELFRVLDNKDRQIVPFEKRRSEIANLLYRERYMEMMNNYKKELLENATIVYFD